MSESNEQPILFTEEANVIVSTNTQMMVDEMASSPLIFNGERVISFGQMDAVHGRPEGTAGRNFREHQNRMAEGRHFHSVPYEVWSQPSFGPTKFVGPSGRGGHRGNIILLTERGYLLLVKSFTDDLAWQVQEALVDNYFRVQPAAPVAVAPVRTRPSTTAKDLCLLLRESRLMVKQLGGCDDPLRIQLLDLTSNAISVVTGSQFRGEEHEPIVVETRIVELGYVGDFRTRMSPIGKCIADRYRAKHGVEPTKAPQRINGKDRSTFRYRVEDQDVVDAGIHEYMQKNGVSRAE